MIVDALVQSEAICQPITRCEIDACLGAGFGGCLDGLEIRVHGGLTETERWCHPKYSPRPAAAGTDRRRSLQHTPQNRERHGPLPQRALVELLETERGSAPRLIMLAHGEPALV